ncbi:MAG: DUF3251 domain-containing protein [Gemmatimonadaceae bacterium]|nr:DUF3251 domain-containing protein [Gemmatimonadaceae bacterium]
MAPLQSGGVMWFDSWMRGDRILVRHLLEEISAVRFSALAIITSCLTACAGQSQADASKLDALARRIDSVEAVVSDLKYRSELSEMMEGWDKIAYLTPGQDGYSVVNSDLGAITVSLANVEAYASGSRVTLSFGNTTSANINGAKAKIEWGAVDTSGVPINESAKSREVKFNETLGRGRWTAVRLVLEGVPPAELGFVRIRDLTHSGIELYR